MTIDEEIEYWKKEQIRIDNLSEEEIKTMSYVDRLKPSSQIMFLRYVKYLKTFEQKEKALN